MNKDLKIIQLQEALRQYEEENDQLKAENEKLKEKINSLLCSENCYKYKQAEQYKQTLAEIKEIAEEVYNDKETQYQASGVCYDILKKINEVENDNTRNI